ncbi:hypothetical protein [uncultured Roseobacter sp.]|uniref:hypothetical protein n=1 Tax=uncultured Roseobacter sp. TaxID=114847 RepID=UPI00261D7D32|nr:hypothetical protein [uncultured Roseobacter sp.]
MLRALTGAVELWQHALVCGNNLFLSRAEFLWMRGLSQVFGNIVVHINPKKKLEIIEIRMVKTDGSVHVFLQNALRRHSNDDALQHPNTRSASLKSGRLS